MAFEAKMLPTNENQHNDPPIKRKAFLGAGLFGAWCACYLTSQTFSCRCDILRRTDLWFAGRGDLVKMGFRLRGNTSHKITSVDLADKTI